MNTDEQRLSQLLKSAVPDPPHALSADQVTTRHVNRSAKSWALPAMAAAAVAVVGVTAGVLASSHASGRGPALASPGGAPTPSAAKPTVTPSGASPQATPSCQQGEIVPAVTGMTQAAAVQVLAADGYTVTVTTTASGQVPAGTVAAQSPAAGTRLPPGGAVDLRVAAANGISGGGAGAPTGAPATPASAASCATMSASPAQGAKVAVPEVVGMTQATALQVTQAAGFTVTIVSVPPPASQSVPSGTVYKQTPAGGSVAARGTQITLDVAPRPAA